MTNDEMDREIAEHVGTADRWLIVKRGYFYRPEAKGYTSSELEAWKLPLAEAKKHEYLIGEEPVTLSRASIPAYSTDLNAMHEAEKAAFTHDDGDLWSSYLDVELPPLALPGPTECAPALARAEAFLRTIGKWRDA